MNTTRATLLTYAVQMLIIGLVGSFVSPDGAFGWYDKGKTALIVCGIGAVLALIIRAVAGMPGKGRLGGILGSLLTFLFMAQGGSKLFSEGRKWSGGDSDLWLKTTLFGAVFVVSVWAFIRIVGEVRGRPSEG